MKILYCSLHPDLNLSAPSGPGTHMREVIKAFEAEGHEVVKFIAGGESMEVHNAPIQFRKNKLRGCMPTWMWLTLKDLYLWRRDRQLNQRMAEVLKKERPDLVYERISYLGTAMIRACVSMGILHFAEFNAPYPQERLRLEGQSLTRFLAIAAEKFQVRTTTRAFTVSAALGDYLREVAGVNAEKIVVTPNAVNPEKFVSDPGAVSRLRQRLGWTKGERVIGFVGSIFPYHGVDLLLKAFERAVTSDRTLRLLIVGDGETLPGLRALAREKQLLGYVHFSGNVPATEVASYIGAMDIAVMAKSDWYMSPVKIFEYGYMGKTILAQDTGPVRDVIVHGLHGWVVQADAESLYNGLQHLLQHPQEASAMAIAFQQKVKDQHTWRKVGRTILTYYS
jgi:glycosyltransferase involved in cell wall biosynthesis